MSDDYDMHHRRHLHFTAPESSTFLAFWRFFANFVAIKKLFPEI